MQADVISHSIESSDKTEVEATLTCSWGFDGSSGFSPYKQNYKNAEHTAAVTVISDENLLATTLIPLRLSNENGEILWNNRMSQSSRFCRPIKLEYVKETKDIILAEKEAIEREIDKLQCRDMNLGGIRVRIRFRLVLTLIDGKVLNIITDTKSMQSCPICHATPKLFNDAAYIKEGKFVSNPTALKHGMSPLHAYIRLLELCLHISYRLSIKKGAVRSVEDKETCAARKAEVQKILWEKLGLRVDKPKTGGCGNSNDGNTARRAFANPDLLAECLGLEKQLIHNFKIILIALSSHLPLNADRFEDFCLMTAEIYINFYSWYPMSAILHKILMHSSEIVRCSVLPVGILAEEASEARNKDYKNYRLHHSRKSSRSANLADLFYRAMDSSDPLISSMNLESRLRKQKSLPFPPEVTNLFEIPAASHHFPESERIPDFNVTRDTFESEDDDESEVLNSIELTDNEEKI